MWMAEHRTVCGPWRPADRAGGSCLGSSVVRGRQGGGGSEEGSAHRGALEMCFHGHAWGRAGRRAGLPPTSFRCVAPRARPDGPGDWAVCADAHGRGAGGAGHELRCGAGVAEAHRCGHHRRRHRGGAACVWPLPPWSAQHEQSRAVSSILVCVCVERPRSRGPRSTPACYVAQSAFRGGPDLAETAPKFADIGSNSVEVAQKSWADSGPDFAEIR